MSDMLYYEVYKDEEEAEAVLKKVKKRKPRNTAMLDEDSPVNKYHKRGRTKIIRKNFT